MGDGFLFLNENHPVGLAAYLRQPHQRRIRILPVPLLSPLPEAPAEVLVRPTPSSPRSRPG